MAGEIKTRKTKHGIEYYVRVELPGADGKRQQKTISARSYKDLERQQRDLLHQIDRGGYSTSPKITLGMFLDEYLAAIKGRRANTYKNYRLAAETFIKRLGNTLLTELRASMIQPVVIELYDRYEDSTVEQRFVKFKTMLKHAVEMEYISKNPCNGVIVTKPDKKEKAVWDENQIKQFTSFLKSCTMRYVALIMLLLKSGARIGEIVALRWADVDFANSTIQILRTAVQKGYNSPKSRNGIRKVPLDQGTMSILQKHKIRQAKEKLLNGEGWNPENLVFCTLRGKRLSLSAASDTYQRMVKTTGLPYISPHGLRHTHITHLLKEGHSVKAVAERVGDDPATIEKIYAHVLPSMREAIVKSIEQIYEERP